MKIFFFFFFLLESAMLIFNSTILNFNDLFAGESMYALIGIAASFCAILILLIFRMSKEIEKRMNE